MEKLNDITLFDPVVEQLAYSIIYIGAWEGLRTLQIDPNVIFFYSGIIIIFITVQGRPTSHELASALVTGQFTGQTTSTQLYWNLARLMEEYVLTRSTLELAKEKGLISPIMEIDELLVFLEDKPWEQST